MLKIINMLLGELCYNKNKIEGDWANQYIFYPYFVGSWIKTSHHFNSIVARAGFEPTTNGLQARRFNHWATTLSAIMQIKRLIMGTV